MTRVTAVEFVVRAKSGKTKPLVLSCRTENSDLVEAYCKLSFNCEVGVLDLTREVVATHVATGLSLQVPVPYLVEIPPRLAEVVEDPCDAARIRNSSAVAFGSARLPNRFSTWSSDWQVSSKALPKLLLALAFDAVVENTDRRPDNPNCLVSGDEIFLIDHELAFPQGLIAKQPPWALGGLQYLKDSEIHIFHRELLRRSRNLDFEALHDQWAALDERYLGKCRAMIPHEWAGGREMAEQAIERIREATKNISGLIAELRRILK